jgi:hypothetical protein
MFATPRIVDGIQRVKGVFLEAPVPSISSHETSKLTGLDTRTCGLILESLRDVGFLASVGTDRYTKRLTESA